MKAAGYAERYRSQSDNETLRKIAYEFLMEIKSIMHDRGGKSDAALFSVLDELYLKWKAFVRITGDKSIKESGFKELVLKQFPFITGKWPKHDPF